MSISIDKDFVSTVFSELASIGSHPGLGVTRLGFNPEECQLQQLVAGWLKETGATVRRDPAGNLIARLPGKDDSLPVVACGSHLDSVPQGGQYDGIAGIVSAVAAFREITTMNLSTQHPLEMIAFACEESSRFGTASIGSKALCGHVNLEQWASLRDSAGITLPEALDQVGLSLTGLDQARRKPTEFKAFIELHIEQGRVLEESGIRIGIVTSIAAPTRLMVTISGNADHSGATPMGLRKDALAAAAEVILSVERRGKEEAIYQSVATVGILRTEPGVMNVIPGKAILGIDVRGTDKSSISRVLTGIRADLEQIKSSRRVSISVEELTAEDPVPLSPKLISVAENSCKKLGIPYLLMPSGAGHDSMYMAQITDAGMIFIPCRKGISHNPQEEACVDDVVLGAEILLDMLLALSTSLKPSGK